jgi:hypothetical protein
MAGRPGPLVYTAQTLRKDTRILSGGHKGPAAARQIGACQKWHILFWDIFERNLAHLMGMKK